jgi:hypothetical protein
MNQEINPNLTPQPEPSNEPQNLIQRLRQWATPPVFPDNQDLTRRAAVINNILIGAIVLSFMYGLSLPFTSSSFLPVAGIILVLLGVLSFGLYNIRRGNVIATGYFLIIFAWILAASTAAMFGGVSGPVFSSFMVVTIAAGLVIGFRAALGIAIGSVIYGLILLLMGNSGVVEPFAGTTTSFFVQAVFNISIITFLIHLMIQNTSEALKAAQETHIGLEATNEELHAVKGDLETAIEENAQKIEQRNRYLDATARIAQTTINVNHLQDMLDQIVEDIANQFGYYHVGMFLIEENGQWAILQAASSTGGRSMIQRNHRLEVGRQRISNLTASTQLLRSSLRLARRWHCHSEPVEKYWERLTFRMMFRMHFQRKIFLSYKQ